MSSEKEVKCGSYCHCNGFNYCADGAVVKKHKTEVTHLRFLQRFETDPLSEAFRGDVVFIGCDEKAVYAHRFILAGKSTVLRGMFTADMKEKQTGTVHVNDITSAVLRSMISYCYTAEVHFTEETPAEELLKAAHKYDIKELKADCEEELGALINKDNFCDKLTLAQLYDAKKLHGKLLLHLRQHIDETYIAFAERLVSCCKP
ncbi:hypothetical protein R1sor_000584 [Riccia sorocarpa]|uniref:BTB domain-containing protein n=1 Tax=Riccia sorocarpa TaxID=122646 RepID=A0ABD3GTI1_9MARC